MRQSPKVHMKQRETEATWIQWYLEANCTCWASSNTIKNSRIATKWTLWCDCFVKRCIKQIVCIPQAKQSCRLVRLPPETFLLIDSLHPHWLSSTFLSTHLGTLLAHRCFFSSWIPSTCRLRLVLIGSYVPPYCFIIYADDHTVSCSWTKCESYSESSGLLTSGRMLNLWFSFYEKFVPKTFLGNALWYSCQTRMLCLAPCSNFY